MAMIMALALWFYAINKHTGDIKEDIQLTINAPPGLTVLDTSSNMVTVGVSGTQTTIDRISDMIKDNKIKARFDIPDISDVDEDNYKRTIRLTKRNFNFPREVRLSSIVPREIDITLGRLESNYIKVQIQKKGVPAPGYEITSEFFYPNRVLVTGPVNILKEADTINTSPLDLSGITSEQNRTFPWSIDLEDFISVTRDGKYVSVPVQCDEKINVWFQVSEQVDIKVFEKVKINVFHPVEYDFKVKLKEEYINLSLKGPRLKLEALSPEDIMAYIDVSSLRPPGPYNQSVICKIPEGLKLDGAPPEAHIDIVEPTVEPIVETK
ncbi:MAG: CdaR family protein [Candidatus Scalindua sp.]|jgi:YbbR domain-containing protein|nr:CdaR family protein [Candidatus Scalindua sp.]